MTEYLSTDILKSHYYSVRSKLVKVIAITNLGYINDGYQLLIKVAKDRDLPLKLQKQSEFLKKNKGANWHPETSQIYYCNVLPYDAKNEPTIEAMHELKLR